MNSLRMKWHRARNNPLSKRQWLSGCLLFVVYAGIMILASFQTRNPILFFPASGIALGVLFLEGAELWPFVYFASFVGSVVSGFPIPFILLIPIAHATQAGIGAYLLRTFKIDPLFRRSRDTFILISVVAIMSLIVPILGSFANDLTLSTSGIVFLTTPWNYRYASSLFSLLILTPFILRWFAKPSFSRTGIEIFETVGIFAILIALDVIIFIARISTIGGVPLVYLLLIPLFVIALRLRPRFVTLAMLITSTLALAGIMLGGYVIGSVAFNEQLFQIEAELIALASMFFIVVSLEENRRLNSNLLRNQLAMLENANIRISSESEAKNDFIAVLAHELRNPLAPVVSGIDILKLKEGLDEDEVETLQVMEDRMGTVKRLLDDLLDISRISEGKITIQPEEVHLESILRTAILSTEHHIKERHQLFTFKEPKESFLMKGDPVRLEQVFSNLITNASKYSDSGDQITLSVEREGTDAKITIRDTGIGIKAESLQHIFLPFHQVELGARTRKGLGIGLALVRNFIELHGGSVSAHSDGEGKGSTFTVILPLLS